MSEDNGRNVQDRAETKVLPPAPRTPERIGRMAGQARERLNESADWLQAHGGDEVRAEVETRIRARPLLSLAIAATAGFLLGRMLRD